MAIRDEIIKKQPKPIETNDFGKKVKKKKPLFPKKGDNAKEVLTKIIYLAAVVVFIAALFILIDYYRQEMEAKRLIEDAQNKYNSLITETTVTTTSAPDDEPLPLLQAAEALLQQNSDTVGWIKINNTKIDLPVVLKADGSDEEKNEYYLTHGFTKEKLRAGTIFADYRTTITDRKQSDNIILYGHNEASNKMFGDLDLYKEKNGNRWTSAVLDFYKQNPTFQFNTNYEQGTYKIFAYFVTAVEDYQDSNNPIFDYNNYIDFDEARYNDFIDNVMKRSKITTDIDCKFGDKFVTLSTCSNEFEPSRFVVIGRKVRDGEDPTVNVNNVSYNEDALEPDWDTIYSN